MISRKLVTRIEVSFYRFSDRLTSLTNTKRVTSDLSFIAKFYCAQFYTRILYNLLGEKLTDAEVEEVLKDCMDPEDDEGFIPYDRKYRFVTMKYMHLAK